MNVTLLSVFVLAYLLGSIPFGLVCARLFGLPDLRKIGSGNIGATNVLRTGNKTAAVLTLLLDAGKGAVAVLAARAFTGSLTAMVGSMPEVGVETAAAVAGFGAFVGHLFPIWILFRGGKGVATYLGVFLALVWPAGLAACGIWLLMAAAFRYSSLAAFAAAASMPILLTLFGRGDVTWLAVLLGVMLLFRHAGNLERLFLGTETRIGASRRTG